MICNCNKLSCTTAALIAGVIIGVVAAFLQVTAVITVTAAFLWVVFGIAVVFLGALAVTAPRTTDAESCGCVCSTLNGILAGALGTILFSVVLLAVGITATSILSAVLVGLLLFFFTLLLGSMACLTRCLYGCTE